MPSLGGRISVALIVCLSVCPSVSIPDFLDRKALETSNLVKI